MGKHKTSPLLRPIRKLLRRKRKLMTAPEMERWKEILTEIYRSDFALTMHPLQTDAAVVPTRAVIDNVQGSSKADANTFLGGGYKTASRYFEGLGRHGFDAAAMDRMLDFGFGSGRGLLHFLPFRMERHGCDVNPAALEWTSKILGEFVDLRLSTLQPPLPYDDDFFDLVISTSVFTHTPFAAQPGWIGELGRILKPGGCVLATVHDFSQVPKQYQDIGWHENNEKHGLHMNTFLTEAKLKELWGAAFDVLEVRRYPPGQAHLVARR